MKFVKTTFAGLLISAAFVGGAAAARRSGNEYPAPQASP